MNVASAPVSPERTRKSALTPAQVQALKARDNWTNWRYLAGNWVLIAATIAAAIMAENALAAGGYSLWWMVPVAAVAITIIGASQHQLGGAIHEGAHYQLFANRTLNEVASDWLAGYPIYTSTHHYRLHHLPHHQFVNDRARDPIFSQAEESGHWLDFPLTHVELAKALLRLLWVPGLIKYTVARARYSALGKGANPYTDPNRPGRPSTTIIGALFAALLPAILITMIVRDVSAPVVLGTWAAIWAVTVIYYALIPDEWYSKGRVDAVVPHRFGAISRISFMALVYGALTAVALAGAGGKAWAYYGLYWVLPLFITFPVFMILREWLQHGNADRGRLTNTRVFLTNPVFRYAVLPWGMDYHLPHHIMANVPHYRLKELHEILLQDPEYAEKGVVVEGMFGAANKDTGRPTAFGILLVEHAPKHREQVHVDDAVLERADIADRAALEHEAAASRATDTG
jgi:fatty acid desaturase